MKDYNDGNSTVMESKALKNGGWIKKIKTDEGIKEVKYEPITGTISKNKQINEDIKKNIKEFTEESIQVITDDFAEQVKKGMYIRYLAYVSSDKKDMLRLGGVVIKVTDKFIALANKAISKAGHMWSVQLKNLKKVFVIFKNEKDAKDKKEQEKKEKQEANELKKQKAKEARELKKKIKAEKDLKKKEELKKKAKQAKQAEKAELKKQKEKDKEQAKIDKLAEQHAIIKKIYYDEGMTYGRDKLYKTVNTQGHKIPRHVVDAWLKQQALYQLTKTQRKSKQFQVLQTDAPNKIWAIDLFVWKNYIFCNVIDVFSRYAYSYLVKDKTSGAVINSLKKLFNKHKVKPKAILSDNGQEFSSEEYAAFLDKNDVKIIKTAPHNPQANGKVERFNGILLELLKKQDMLSKTTLKLTQAKLNRILKSYNTAYHSIIDMTPQEATETENTQAVLKRNEKFSSVEHQNIDDIKVGDKVRIQITNIDKKDKPYRLLWSEKIYTVKQVRKPRGKNLTTPIKYKVAGDTQLYKRNELQLIKNGVENTDLVFTKYTPEKITDVDLENNTVLVKWKGYASSESTDEDMKSLAEDIGNAEYNKMLADFVSNTQKGKKYKLVLNTKTKRLEIKEK